MTDSDRVIDVALILTAVAQDEAASQRMTEAFVKAFAAMRALPANNERLAMLSCLAHAWMLDTLRSDALPHDEVLRIAVAAIVQGAPRAPDSPAEVEVNLPKPTHDGGRSVH